MLHNIASCVCFVIFGLLIPSLAYAQAELAPSFEEKFGGWYLDADIMGGMGAFLDCNESFGDCYGYVSDNREIYENIGKQKHMVEDDGLKGGMLAHLRAGYFFGSRVFVGPELSVSGGFPMLFNIDVRVRFVAPIVTGHAIDAAIGIGYNIFDVQSRIDEYVLEGIYIPMQIGYDYTFDNGITFGASFLLNLRFMENEKLKDYHAWQINADYDKIWKKDETFAYVGFWGIGVHLGYRFGL